MPRDLIDAQTFEQHLARLQGELHLARAEYDEAASVAAIDDSAEAKEALSRARGRMADAEATIAALMRAREIAEAAEQQAKDERKAAELRQDAIATAKLGDELIAESEEIDADEQALMTRRRAFDERYVSFRQRMTNLILDKPRERIVCDTLSHREDGVVSLGRVASLPGATIQGIEAELGIAKRFAAGHSISQCIADRVRTAINLASTDVPDLKVEPEQEQE